MRAENIECRTRNAEIGRVGKALTPFLVGRQLRTHAGVLSETFAPEPGPDKKPYRKSERCPEWATGRNRPENGMFLEKQPLARLGASGSDRK